MCALHVMADVFFPLSQMCTFFFVFIIFNFCALHHPNVMCAVWCAHFHVYVYDAIQFRTICGRWIHYSRYTATIWAVRRPIITISQFYAFVVSHYSCSHWLSIGSKSSLYHELYICRACVIAERKHFSSHRVLHTFWIIFFFFFFFFSSGKLILVIIRGLLFPNRIRLLLVSFICFLFFCFFLFSTWNLSCAMPIQL